MKITSLQYEIAPGRPGHEPDAHLVPGGQAPPLSIEFSRQEYLSGWPFLSPRDLPNPGIEPMSPALAGRLFTTESPGKPRDQALVTLKYVNTI